MRTAEWHDVECASYAADLPLWRELAERGRPGEVLDIGCGTGRVALDLAARGHAVTGIDADPDLVRALDERARVRELDLRAHAADARSFTLDGRFALAIAPMQVVQLLGGPGGRTCMLEAVRRHMEPGAVLALALADPFEAGDAPPGDSGARAPTAELLPPLPDVLERDGWMLYSTPVSVSDEGDAVAIHRHRQAVSPGGELTEEAATIRLDTVPATTLEREALEAGYRLLAQRQVEPTRDYVGSTVVMAEMPA